MLKRYGFLLMMIFLASCTPHHYGPQDAALTPLTYTGPIQYRKVSSFNQVDAEGLIDVTLHTGYKDPQVVLRGDPRDLQQVKTMVANNMLYVTLAQGFPKFGPVHADIQARFLNRVIYKGKGLLTGNQLHTSVLDLILLNEGTTRLGGSLGLRQLVVGGNGLTELSGINSRGLQIKFLKGNPRVHLAGMANLTSLITNTNVSLSMYWLKSDTLTIRAKNRARIQLAGVVNRLDVELAGYAYFKGRHLRAQRSFVKTHDHAVAEISSVNHQSTLALGASNIYYYNLPNTRADFMAYNGSVLDMREWNRIDIRDFDRYNKQFP